MTGSPDRDATFDEVHPAPPPTRQQVEDERDGALWRLLMLVHAEDDTIPTEFLDVRDTAAELGDTAAGRASEAHVRHTTEFVRAAIMLAQAGISLEDIPDCMRAVKTLAEADGPLNVERAARALGGVRAVNPSATPEDCILTVRAALNALR